LPSPAEVLPLESRRLFCAEHLGGLLDGDDFGTFPAISTNQDLNVTGGSLAAAAILPTVSLDSVPALDSRLGAAAKLYLDFTGDVTPLWVDESPGVTPAYDQDGDSTSFSSGELASIRDIWARVSEKYSPFNIDVTTVNPGTFLNRAALKVVIGGDGAWLGSPAGGVAYVGSFTNSLMNTVFVFPDNLANGNSKYVAEGVAHESGHAFGLQHQGLWSGTTLAQEYNPGTSAASPIMGGSYDSARGLWWRGTPSTSPYSTQDDMSILSTTNGFGYRTDDAGNTAAAAKPATVVDTVLGAAGVIERTTDTDVYSFDTGEGTVSLSGNVAAVGATLDLKLELRDAAGTLLASADTASLGETLSATVTAGTYYLNVKSHGGYGDVGQYTITGTTVAAPVAPALPAPLGGLTGTSVSMSQIRLDWSDPSADIDGYHVYRSGNGTTWTQVATLAPTATGYNDVHLRRLTLYRYKVNPFNVTGEAADGDVIGVWTSSGATGSSPKATILFSSAPITAAASAPVAAPVTGRISGALAALAVRRQLLLQLAS
jgi:hypothetical protein